MFYRKVLLVVCACAMEVWSQASKEAEVKIAISVKRPNFTIVDMNEHLQPENTVTIEEIIGRLCNDSLQLFSFWELRFYEVVWI